MASRTKQFLGVLALGLASKLAWAVTLTGVEFSALPGDRTEIHFAFDGAAPEPQGYTIEQPARIALDLPGVTSGLASKQHTLGSGNAQSLTVIEANGRTRVIVNLVELVPYASRVEGNTLVVQVGGDVADAPAAAPAKAAPAPVAAAPAGKPTLTDVDFRRGDKGDGQVVVTFSNSKASVDLSEQGGLIRLEVRGMDVPENLRRRLDVADFATPVKRVDTLKEGSSTVILIKPEGNYDYLAYQADNQFTLSVEPVTEDEADRRRKEKFPYSGEKLSLNFQDIEVRSVLQLIADFTGLNLVASDTVGGSITLRLQNVPWDQALELVLKTKGLDKRQIGNVLLVAPANEIAAREKLELEASKQVKELAPVRLEIIQVNYAKASDIVELLKQDAELISSRGFISSDSRTNTISVRETSDKLEQIRRLVGTWDIPVKQVLIEARIVRASTDFAQDLGIEWGGSATDTINSDDTLLVGGSTNTIVDVGNGGATAFPDALMVDLGVKKSNTSSFAVGFTNGDIRLAMELSALETDGHGEIVAQPKIVTADRQRAKIKSGEEIPYQEASSSGATSVSFKEAALSLEVEPQITPDGKIIMDLVVNQDSRGVVTAGVPSIDTNEIETQVLVSNGQTVVLGGIFQTEKSETVTKTPFLGDIPYLGRLFTKTESVDKRAELLIFITPKILHDGLVD